MLQRITGPVPEWARRDHPFLAYQLRQARNISRRARYLRALGVVLALGVLGVGGFALATDFFQNPAGQHLTEQAVTIVFWPLLIIQLSMRVTALALTTGTVGDEQRRQTWDNLRATSHGTELTFRVRWVSVFYRLRSVLILVISLRALLILGVLLDLTAFQGRYLDLLIGGITPSLPVPIAALMLSLLLTASLLLPLTAVGMDAAVGLLVSTVFQQRIYSALVQFLLIIARVAVAGVLTWLAIRFLGGRLSVGDVLAWLTMGGFAAMGDWGLRFLHLGSFGDVWAVVPYGIFIGPALLVYSLAQAILTDWLLDLAVRTAERRG